MKRLNRKNKLARGEKWADWMRNVKDDILYYGLAEWQELKYHQKQIDYPEKFICVFELRDIFDKARTEVNQKYYNLLYPTEPIKVDVLMYKHLNAKLTEYKQLFPFDSAIIEAYISEFKRLPEASVVLDNFILT